MRRNIGESRSHPGPSDLDTRWTLLNKYANIKGYSLLASKSPLSKELKESKVPPLGTYDVDPVKKFRKAYQPFGSNAKRDTFKDFICTPGTGTYLFTKDYAQKICMCFGSDKFNYPSVQIACSPTNLAICEICLTTPIGDYWRKESSEQVLCRPCMESELNMLKRCSKKTIVEVRRLADLQKFVRYRYCGFFHDHAGTTAAVQIMTKKDLKDKIKKENYLASFGY